MPVQPRWTNGQDGGTLLRDRAHVPTQEDQRTSTEQVMADEPSRGKLIAAFAAVYIIWGSTYLAIVYAIETLPPFLMAGGRFLVAGTLLFAWSMAKSERRPTLREWKAALIIGALLLLGGNGAVTWAEQFVPSGITALLVAGTPCWMVLLEWLWKGGARPGARTVVGLLLGFGGIALLVGPSAFTGGGEIDPLGALVLMIGSLAWAVGSIYSKHASVPHGALLSTGMQMLTGGLLLVVAGSMAGEWSQVDAANVSTRSVLALAYLIIFGAIVGYSAYVWLLRVSTPARVSTYAYVNPVVAVLLGWAIAGEVFTLRMAIAAAVIVAGVALITLEEHNRSRAARAAVRTRAAP
ncbi:MAG TPA: drug/metabolite exporter YedA [Longimicrobiales bacterium]|nr:drug/metabolite exporter YedA [Longimicrobiales bacterium]